MKKSSKIIVLAILVLTLGISLQTQAQSNSGFVKIFNGKNLDGWYPKIKSGDAEMAKRIFAVENGTVHVLDKSFPDKFELNGANNTHGLFYTKKKYSKFILRFEYKWGSKISNNFDRWQYDAGCYYHVVDDKIWPIGIEYQIRYDHIKKENHTGDFWTSETLTWFSEEGTNRFVSRKNGGKEVQKKNEILASIPQKINTLNGKWNKCEVIVMGDKYAIHKVNGEIVNMAVNLPFHEGVIGFQSETAEIFYRNIQIKEFEEAIPMEKFLK